MRYISTIIMATIVGSAIHSAAVAAPLKRETTRGPSTTSALSMVANTATFPSDIKVTKQEEQKDATAIKELLNTFSTTLANKDKEGFLSMFASPDAPFAMSALYLPNGQRHQIPDGLNLTTVSDFVERTLLAEPKVEETFDDIFINVTEEVATVSAHYTFKKDGTLSHNGYEVWSMAKVNDDWKIISVIWTAHIIAPK
jgi:hypothetical protein